MAERADNNSNQSTIGKVLLNVFPFAGWFKNYNLATLRVDFISGLTVALVLVPQSMAYAQLAGLPAYYGLYAAFLPPMIASLFGSSRQLATGPVAVVSLMTATALEPLATAGSEAFIAYAIMLALIVGSFQLILGLLRLGVVVNLLSHPVVNGFTNAAALIIASSQLSKLFGVYVDKAEHHYETIYNVIISAFSYTHWPTVGLAALAFAIMIGLRWINRKIPAVLVAVMITTVISWASGFQNNNQFSIECLMSEKTIANIKQFNSAVEDIENQSQKRIALADSLSLLSRESEKLSPGILDYEHRISLLNLAIEKSKKLSNEFRAKLRNTPFYLEENNSGNQMVYALDNISENKKSSKSVWHIKISNKPIDTAAMAFYGGGAVVGTIPSGLPALKIHDLDFNIIISLFPMAVIISLLGFMEAISIAKAMAIRTGQRLDPNQELIGQGLGNIIGSFGQSYAVSGSFSRSAVNIQAGAITGLSNVFSSGIVVITLLFFTPLLYYLPQAVLAAIIMMAVIGLVNIRTFAHAWRTQRYDGVIGVITFICTLAFAPHLDRGIMIGVGLSLAGHFVRSMKPDMALLAKHADGTYRNFLRFNLRQCKHISVIRYNGSLFFANVNYLEEIIFDRIAKMPELRHIIIVGNGINELDSSGEELLSNLVGTLREGGYDLSISGLNDWVVDAMRRSGLVDKIGEDHLFRNANRAVLAVYEKAHKDSTERWCPLKKTGLTALPVAKNLKPKNAGNNKKNKSK